MSEQVVAIQSGARLQNATPSAAPTGRSQPAAAPRPVEDARTEIPSVDDKRAVARQVVEELNYELEVRSIALRFSVDESADQIVVTITDTGTGKVIRQVPPVENLRISAHLREVLGALLNTTA